MRDFLVPNYQPILDRLGAVHAYETFMRMRGDKSGTARFVPRWERSRIISTADDSMIEQVSQLASQSAYRGNMRFCLNISTISIETDAKGLAARLGALRRMNRGITAEVQSSVVMHNYNRFIDFVSLCKHHGVGVALEDMTIDSPFGSMRLLENARPEFIKIDARYLATMIGTADYTQILRRIELASNKGIKIIVKNIDSRQGQKNALLAGAHFFQGRFFAKESERIPAPAPVAAPVEGARGARRSLSGRLAREIGPIRRFIFGDRAAKLCAQDS